MEKGTKSAFGNSRFSTSAPLPPVTIVLCGQVGKLLKSDALTNNTYMK